MALLFGRVEIRQFLWVAVAYIRVGLIVFKSLGSRDDDLIAAIDEVSFAELIKILLSIHRSAILLRENRMGGFWDVFHLFFFASGGQHWGVYPHLLMLSHSTFWNIHHFFLYTFLGSWARQFSGRVHQIQHLLLGDIAKVKGKSRYFCLIFVQ